MFIFSLFLENTGFKVNCCCCFHYLNLLHCLFCSKVPVVANYLRKCGETVTVPLRADGNVFPGKKNAIETPAVAVSQ